MGLEITPQDRPETHYVGMAVTARFSEFGSPGGPNEMIPLVYQWLADHGIAPRSGPLYIYRNVGAPGEPVDLTVAVPVAEAVEPTNGLVAGSLPAGEYVVGRHVGEPDEIPAAHVRVQEWADVARRA
ncbi:MULTISPECIES: GyrI-like domain-containing protein [unclassified Dietzia]|uniref:GyrI-like domain-containing protein n=1 Tax=unclassified Dietzia TaxID=2617939 RepID=UPI000D22999D|nr:MULTISPECIES: GyrI-like domain-containing protein [unclassified Dietzia]AVZ38929.1 AraC family transcriptional regulator [Dietzia sp. JS16-p6b]QGW24070.1 transcriptional regulator [Dietzia sp. DQ12-45-1b]